MNKLFKDPVLFYIIIGVISVFLIATLDFYDKDFNWHDIVVEAHGLIFDLLIFGLMLAIYDRVRGKVSKIERLQEEISDYRGWNNDEAMHRIVGCVKRLYESGVTKFYLGNCFLEKADLSEYNFHQSSFAFSRLAQASFVHSDLSYTMMVGADMQNTWLTKTDFEGADLRSCKFNDAHITKANFSKADLNGADFSNAKIASCEFDGCDLTNAIFNNAKVTQKRWFSELEGRNIKGIGVLIKKYQIDSEPEEFINGIRFFTVTDRKDGNQKIKAKSKSLRLRKNN